MWLVLEVEAIFGTSEKLVLGISKRSIYGFYYDFLRMYSLMAVATLFRFRVKSDLSSRRFFSLSPSPH